MKLSRRAFVAAGMGAIAVAGTRMGSRWMASYKRRHRPNIILFVTDDMRFDAAGFAGNTIIKTPHLDQMARQGFVFDNNFVTTSVCPVSRASIITGDYALRHGVYDFDHNMRSESYWHSFPVLLQRSGYYTGFIGKWGQGGVQPVGAFNEWYGFAGQGSYYPVKNVHMTDVQTNQALQFLKHTPKDRPFLLVVCYKAPHTPLLPQARYAGLYAKDTIPRARTDRDAAFRATPLLIQHSLDRGDYLHSALFDERHFQFTMKQYYRLITGIDDSVGTIMHQLLLDKRLEDTSIMFTSDNGLLEGEHGLEGKWCMYEESIRVPLVMRLAPTYFPDIKPGHLKSISLNIDISPTILEMASIAKPPHIVGASLLPLVTGHDKPWREGFYYEHPGWDRQNIIACEGYRGVQWKYVRYARGREVEECLFNLATDPGELHNLVRLPQFRDTLNHMRQLTIQQKQAILKA